MEIFKLVDEEKYDSENLDVIFGIFGRSTNRKQKHTHYGLSSRLAARASQKTRKLCHHLLNETSVLLEFDINVSF